MSTFEGGGVLLDLGGYLIEADLDKERVTLPSEG